VLAGGEGERIDNVLVRAGAALALISASNIVHGRFIDLETREWGATTASLAIDATRAVLSPDHKRIAAVHDKRYVVLLDLDTGKVGPIVCFAPATKTPDDMFREVNALPMRIDVTPLGFADDTTIGCLVDGHLEWAHAVDGTYPLQPADSFQISSQAAAVADQLAVAAVGGSLGLRTAKGLQYLGYGFTSMTRTRAGPGGMLIGRGDAQPLLLDSTLHAKRRFTLAPEMTDMIDMLALDDRYLLVLYASKAVVGEEVAIYDTTLHRQRDALRFGVASPELRYEPATHLLALERTDEALLVAIDPNLLGFDKLAAIGGLATQAYLTDPALAGGVVAVTIHKTNGRTRIDEFHGEDLPGGVRATARSGYELFEAPLLAVDRAARIYVADGSDVSIYEHGPTRVTNIHLDTGAPPKPVVAETRVESGTQPSPDADVVAVLARHKLMLYAVDGTLRWQVPAQLASEIQWIGSTLYMRGSGAFAKIDRATGRIVDRACGWSFGLTATAFEASPDAESMCDEP
jgi:hypothetical protein